MFEPRNSTRRLRFRLRESCQTVGKAGLEARDLNIEGLMHARARVFEGGGREIDQVDARVCTMLQDQRQFFAVARTQFNHVETRPGRTHDLVAMCLQQFRFGARDSILWQPHDRIEECRPECVVKIGWLQILGTSG